MEESYLKICRLCLNIIENTNFEKLEGFNAELLKTVLVNFNLSVSANPIICCNCSNILQEYYEFKMICINNEPLKVNLEDIKETFENSEMCNKQQTCLLCLNLISGNFANMNDEFDGRSVQNMLNRCIPELELKLTNKPLVCQACLDSLKIQLNFIQSCLDIEEKIKLFCKLQNKSSNDIIVLYDVLKFFERIKPENKSEGNSTILENEAVALPEANYRGLKMEEVDISEGMEMKTEEDENETSNREDENSCLENQVQEQSNKTVEEQNSSKTAPNNSAKRFPCNVCNYVSKRSSGLKRHLLIHKDPSELKMYECSICPYETKDKCNLKNHMYVHNSEPFKCQECQFKSTNLNSFIRHKTFHKISGPLQCAVCPYTTKDNKLFKEHRITHKHGYYTEKFQCNSCNYVAYQKRYLIKHISTMHKRDEMHSCYLCSFSCKEKSSLESHVLEHENSFKMPLHKCEHCTFMTTRQKYLKRHLRKRHRPRKTSPDVSSSINSKQEDANLPNQDQKQSNNTVKEQDSSKSETKNSEKTFNCLHCSYATNVKFRLIRHLETHKNESNERDIEKRFNCLHCSYATNIKFCLIRHLLTHKNKLNEGDKDGVFRCKLCNFESKLQNGLKGHMHVHGKSKKINQNEEQSKDSGKKFSCSKCSYTAKCKQYVNRHMLSHKSRSETTLFLCSVCGIEYKRFNNLKRHMVTHNDPVNVPKFKCTMCTYESRWKEVLDFHMKTHNTEKFKCQYCPFESRNVMYIKQHIDVHKKSKR